ncbi:putative RDD family membrane protein YckC [Neisseria sp. HSC-16F19]|nr:RDD family protein [Neisseria sp. HSC-16F19]MCP2040213.1 putative RDD family membrane protein YckC [Neisseria sp. HSC-16F19]
MNTQQPNDFRNPYQTSVIDTPYVEDEIEVEIAGPWARIAAYIINTILTVLVVVPLIIDIVRLGISENSSVNAFTDLFTGVGMIATVVLGFGLLIWQLVWMTTRGQSIGKRMLGIKVVNMEGQNPGFVGTVLMREVVYQLIILVITFIIGFIAGMFLAAGGTLEAMDEYSTLFDALGYIPLIICLIMLFNKNNMRRTLQDYLAKTIVIKA